ncbi:MAG: dTDP-4-dehydrorhamnose 3,5-epimerase family protein [Acidobacteria bacterium]|nr:dTDP-4-dehydrorhamnose 3,5-epimerase family protein [Acidobacteriota bacterium]
MSHRELRPEDILAEHRGAPKSYPGATSIDGVEALRLKRLVDDRGLFLEIYRKGASGAGSKELARFFDGIEVAQMNYSLVDLTSTVKGLHYHLKQTDIWFCPPHSKMKIVLWDLRADSPTSGTTQVVVTGGGKDLWLKIPPGVAHGYRPLTDHCALLYIVTRAFDLDDPDEYRVPWDHPAVRDLWNIENS